MQNHLYSRDRKHLSVFQERACQWLVRDFRRLSCITHPWSPPHSISGKPGKPKVYARKTLKTPENSGKPEQPKVYARKTRKTPENPNNPKSMPGKLRKTPENPKSTTGKPGKPGKPWRTQTTQSLCPENLRKLWKTHPWSMPTKVYAHKPCTTPRKSEQPTV